MKTTATFIRTLALTALLLLCQLNSMAQTKSIIIRRCADLAVEKIILHTISGNSINFTFTVKNIGADTIHLDRMYFQAYVSKDYLYDLTDIPAGGSIFGNHAPALGTNDTYDANWTSNPNADLTEYKYLIIQVKVRSGYSQPECRTDNNTSFTYIGCAIAELVVYPLTIKSVNGNSVNFTYTVKNTGWGTLYLNRMYFQAYVSKDYVLDATDQPAGGSILGDNAPDLAKDETYSGSWTSTPFVSLTEYPILIIEFKERYGYSMPECNPINIVSQYIGCNLAELAIDNIDINTVIGNSVNFTYTIKNTGWDTLFTDRMYFQTYLSTDNVYDGTDKPAGGSIIGFNTPALVKDETYSGSWTSNASVDVSIYKYLIIQFKVRYGFEMPECDILNNSTYKLIPAQTFTLDKFELDKIIYTGFRVNANTGNNSISITAGEETIVNYKIYSIDAKFNGQILSEGSSNGSKEINLAEFKSGLYIIHATDGRESYSEKFLISE